MARVNFAYYPTCSLLTSLYLLRIIESIDILPNSICQIRYKTIVIVVLYLQGPAQDEVIAKLRSAFLEIVKEYKAYTEEERKQAVAAGGLHVVGTERHESRRIDNQVNWKYIYKIFICCFKKKQKNPDSFGIHEICFCSVYCIQF